MNGEATVRIFLREYPALILTREQQNRLAEIIEEEARIARYGYR